MPVIKQFSNSGVYPKDFTFYVLCKGLNSGKPLQAPCPNCFVIQCSSAAEMQRLQCVCFALWKSKSFEFYLTGSVIVFLRISDFKKLLQEDRYQNISAQTLAGIERIELAEKAVARQLAALQQLKIAILREALK